MFRCAAKILNEAKRTLHPSPFHTQIVPVTTVRRRRRGGVVLGRSPDQGRKPGRNAICVTV